LQLDVRVGRLELVGRLHRNVLLERRPVLPVHPASVLSLIRARPRFDLAAVGFSAFAVRAIHAWFVSKTPFFEGPIIDAQTYRAFAMELAKTGDFGGAFYQPPLYPGFLALLHRIGVSSAWGVALLQSALGATTAALMVLVGRKLASDASTARAVGLVTGFAAAFLGPLVLFDLELLPPVLVHLLLVGALLLALGSGKLGVGNALLGLLLGIAMIGWPLVAVLAPGLLALRARRMPGRRWSGVALALVFLAAPVALTARHNSTHDGEGVLVSYNSGINLWLGNNAKWRDTWRARPGAHFEPEFERPDREGVTRPSERSKFFVSLALRDAAERPFAAFLRTTEKLYYVWHGREIRRNQDIETLREASPILRALLWEVGIFFPFGIVAPLGLLAIFRRFRDIDVRVLAVSAFAYSLVLAAFFVSSRYRLPLALFLVPLAADQVCHFLTAGQGVRNRLAAFVAIAVGLNLPNDFTKTFRAGPAERAILEAHAWRNQNELERAAAISETLVQRFAGDANVQMLRAEILIAERRCRNATLHLARAIELAPRATTPRVMLATCYDELGEPARAEREFASALSLHPYHPVALKRAAQMYLRHGRTLEARSLLTRFARAGYDDPEVEGLLLRLGRSASNGP
jgi:tetratricopeptide (TPR) repeat protein